MDINNSFWKYSTHLLAWKAMGYYNSKLELKSNLSEVFAS